ncbi:MAG: hypothetical protein RLN89_02345 [Parvibaculum sp.]
MANEPGHFGSIINSFAGALAAILVAGGAFYVLNPAPVPTAPSTPATGPAATSSLDVPEAGAELMVDIANVASSVTLTFAAAGDYRVELRALTAEVDPYLALFSADGATPAGANDDAAGTLDAIIGITIAQAGEVFRADATAFGETQGPAMLRVVPGTIDAGAGTTTGGAAGFPSGEVSALEAGEGVDTQLGSDGVWYRYRPAQSGIHRISIRAADESFDTVAYLAPVLPGKAVPAAGIDIGSLSSSFTSDDDDGLNPKFQRYMVKDADYFLFVKSFDNTAEGSIALMAEYVGDDARIAAPVVTESPMEEMEDNMELQEGETEMEEPTDTEPSSGKN